MTGVEIADTVPTGQQLLIDGDHPFTVKQGSTAVFETTSASATANFTFTDAFLNKFSYKLGDISTTYTIDYYTKIIDINTASHTDSSGLDTLYQNHDSVGFGNKVFLKRSGTTDLGEYGAKTYRSQVLAKSVAEAYDYVNHTVEWSITVNRNRLPMTNVILSGTLPAGMKLLIDAQHPFLVTKPGETAPVAISPTMGSSGGSSFPISLATSRPSIPSPSYPSGGFRAFNPMGRHQRLYQYGQAQGG